MTARTVRLQTTSPDATRRLGSAVARLLEPGDVVSLAGELGAGKTCLVQGIASGLDVPGPVTSPTFMLERRYQGRLPLVHLDVYRLDRVQHVLELGDDALAPDVVTVVEWGDTIRSVLPPNRLDVELRHVDDAGDRDPDPHPPTPVRDQLRTVVAVGRGSWAARLGGLGTADEFASDVRAT